MRCVRVGARTCVASVSQCSSINPLDMATLLKAFTARGPPAFITSIVLSDSSVIFRIDDSACLNWKTPQKKGVSVLYRGGVGVWGKTVFALVLFLFWWWL